MASEVPGKEYKRFLLKVDDDFADRVAFSKRFVEEHFEIRAGTVHFWTSDGEGWEFRVLTDENGIVYLTEGWSTFLAVYDLQAGDQLQCSYDKDRTFIVKIYKKDGVEEDLSVHIVQELFAEDFGIGDDLDSDIDKWSDDSEEAGEDWDDDWSPSSTPSSNDVVNLLDVMDDGHIVEEFDVEVREVGEQGENVPLTDENALGLQGSPLPTPAPSNPLCTSAQGSVTSKKRAAADRFRGLVKGERLDFLAAVGSVAEEGHEQGVGVNAGNLSPGTVATNVGQMIGNLRVEEDSHVEKFVRATGNGGGVHSNHCGNSSGAGNCVMLPYARTRPIVAHCAVKVAAANMRRKYRLQLEFDFARDNLPFGQSNVVVHTEAGGTWEIGCFRGVCRARVNSGWKKLAIDNNVHVRDMVVFVTRDGVPGVWDASFFRQGV